MSRKSRGRSTPGGSPSPAPRGEALGAARGALWRKRLWALRLILLVGSPLLFLFGMELILRIAGFGYPTCFFLPSTIQGRPMVVQNDRFSWRFLGRHLARQPFPAALPRR